jgi:hypothetical protein
MAKKTNKSNKGKETLGAAAPKVTPQQMIDKLREKLANDDSLTAEQKEKINRQFDFYQSMTPPDDADLSQYPKLMGQDEFEKLALKLENAHAVFDRMWQLGQPIFDARIPTACVRFRRDGTPLEYRINPFFWNALSDEGRRFVIVHECLHIILNHGARAQDSKYPQASNVAMDVVVNHLTTDRFGLIRERIDFSDMYCWRDTVFFDKEGNPIRDKDDNEILVKEDGSFEYYMKQLMKSMKPQPCSECQGKKKCQSCDGSGKDDQGQGKGEGDKEDGDGQGKGEDGKDKDGKGKDKGGECCGNCKGSGDCPNCGGTGEEPSNQFGQGAGGVLVDDHSGFGGDEDGEYLDPIEGAGKVISDLNEILTNEEKADLEETIKNNFESLTDDQIKEQGDKETQEGTTEATETPGFGRGTVGGNGVWTFKKKVRIPEKMKFVTLVRKWVNKNRHIFAEEETWTRIARRLALWHDGSGRILNGRATSGMFLPSEYEDPDADEKKRIQVHLFLDTSGSCVSYADRFWRFAESIPKKYFDVKPHCFDTQVYDVNFKDKQLFGFGGTSFEPIEQHIVAETVAKGKRYPEIVFIVTDGWGSAVMPRHAERWHWFMTEGRVEEYVPKESSQYNIEDFEDEGNKKKQVA